MIVSLASGGSCRLVRENSSLKNNSSKADFVNMCNNVKLTGDVLNLVHSNKALCCPELIDINNAETFLLDATYNFQLTLSGIIENS
jgi:hypothetical protein